MKLTQIKEEYCSDCGSRVVAESQDRQHTNGHYNESRRYACGKEVAFSPNFMKVEVENPCPKSSKERAIKEKRKRASKKIIDMVNKLKIDKEWKKQILNSMKYILVN